MAYRTRAQCKTTWPFILIVLICLLPSLSHAIPAFARKYGTACTTCHVGGPKKLNPFGESFRLNGYRMLQPAETDLRRSEEIALGAPARKQLFPNSVWPGELPAAVGLSLFAQHRFRADLERSAGHSRFESPHLFGAVLGGTLGDTFSVFGEYVMFANGETGLGHLLAVVSDPLGHLLPRGALSMRIGRFAPAIEPYADNNRRTISHSSVSDYRVVADGFRLRDRQAGIEIYGRPRGRMLWSVGLVNGEDPLDERTNHKDVYGAAEVKFGGSSYMAAGTDQLGKPAWHDNSITIGLGAWIGRHQLQLDEVDPPFTNRFVRLVGKLRVKISDFDIQSAAVFGRDRNPDGTRESVDSVAWTVQGDYVLFPWLQFVVRYDEERIDNQPTQRTITPHMSLFARMNVWLRLETTIDVSGSRDKPEIQLELSYAF